MVKLAKLTRVILAVLVVLTQTGLVRVCVSACQTAMKPGMSCCKVDANGHSKCKCPKAVSRDTSAQAIVAKTDLPTAQPLVAVLPSLVDWSCPTLGLKPTEVVDHNHGPPDDPPIFCRLGRAPPVC
ncbi:MAG: hypothetical protein JST12_01050 [Armatimonadetes bacterium]|nr:hypothetical protein [Armatimonadota bacterium]MBS1700221.1 hypothetical protein [Armatimonadota bacterium]